MSYASIMVHVDADSELGGRVNIAAELSDRFRAHLIGVAGWAPMPVFLANEALYNPDTAVFSLQDMKSLLDRKGKHFEKLVTGNGRSVEWRSVLNFPSDVVAREGRAADLLIISNVGENRDPFRTLDPGAVILAAGRPTLVVPGSVNSLPLKRVAIAWQDVREARRAAWDALPILQMAESVVVVEVCEDDANQAWRRVKDVSGYLSRHRIEIVTERLRPAEVNETSSLLRFIHDEQIDLVVAGAYGHSRLGEWAFGGVTRGLMAESPICCLFSH